jgi:RNA polymerase sigma factor (sigma-70 family)
MPDDKELLRRYARYHVEPAFATLVQRHLPLVYTAALRRVNGDGALAHDVAQAVFVALAREAPKLLGHEVLAGWLYVATRHAAANAMRSEQRRKHREQEAWAMHDNVESADAEANWEQLRPELDAVMDDLDPAERDAVLLRYFEGRPYAEIGSRMGTTEDAARRRVDRALDKLRDLLTRRGVTSTAAALGGLLSANSVVGAPVGLAGVVTASVLAGGVTVASAGFITFMATNKLILGLAGATLLAGGAAVFQYQEAQRIAGELEAAREAQATLRASLAREQELARGARVRIESSDRHASRAQQSAGTADTGRTTPAPAVAGPLAKPITSFAGKMDILYASPEYVQLQAQQYALSISQQYGPLYRSLQLSPEVVARFEALMVERQQAQTDIFAAARAQGVSLEDPVFRKLHDPSRDEIEGRLKGLLGAEGYAAFKEYSTGGRGSARSAANNLAASTYYTNAPLTGQQADQLVELIATNTPRPSQGAMVLMPQPDWDAVYARAGEILTPAQLAALRANNERSALARKIAELSDKLLQEAAVAGSSPGGG